MPRASGLSTVQELYVLQMELSDIFADDVPAERLKEAKKQVKEFGKLLGDAKWEYMGGEDVYEDLRQFEKTAKERLKGK